MNKEELSQLRSELQKIVGCINMVIPFLWELHVKASGIEKEFEKLSVFCNSSTAALAAAPGEGFPKNNSTEIILASIKSVENNPPPTLESLAAAGLISLPKKQVLKKTESLTSVLEKNLDLQLKKE